MYKIHPSVDISKIQWDDYGCANVMTMFGSGPVYQPWGGVFGKMCNYCDTIIRDIWKLNNNEPLPYTRDRMFCSICRMHPELQRGTYSEVCDEIKKLCIDFIDTKIAEILANKLDDKNLSDCEFLTLLGTKRNYKSGCAICLTDKIMGTTCTCGHTEIAVFRPCGHSVCANPCFDLLMNSVGIELKPQIFSANGQTWTRGTGDKVQKDIRVSGFNCPICRTRVNSTFRAEETYIIDTWKDELKVHAIKYAGQHFTVTDDITLYHK